MSYFQSSNNNIKYIKLYHSLFQLQLICTFYHRMESQSRNKLHSSLPNLQEIDIVLERNQSDILCNQQERAICNIKDNRIQWPIQTPQYNCIGLLISSKGHQSTYGTAFLISDTLLLTVAHNIFDYKSLSNFDQIYFLPAFVGDINDKKIKKYRVNNFKKSDNYNRIKHSFQDDYALLLLEEPIPRDNYYIVGYDYTQVQMDKFSFDIVGYPNDLNQKQRHFKNRSNNYYTAFGANGTAKSLNKWQIFYEIATDKGSSGSPLLLKFNLYFKFVVGLHQAFKSKRNQNSGILFSSKIVQQLKLWATQLTGKNFNFITMKMHRIDIPKVNNKQNKLSQTQFFRQNDRVINHMLVDSISKEQILDKKMQKAHYYYKSHEYSECLIFLQQMQQKYRQLLGNQSKKSIKIYNMMGLCYKQLNQLDYALSRCYVALILCDYYKDSYLQAQVLTNIGNVYYKKYKETTNQLQKQNYLAATMFFYQKGLHIYQKLNIDPKQYLTLQTNMLNLQSPFLLSNQLNGQQQMKVEQQQMKVEQQQMKVKQQQMKVEQLKKLIQQFKNLHKFQKQAITCYNLAGQLWKMGRDQQWLTYQFRCMEYMIGVQPNSKDTFLKFYKRFPFRLQKLLQNLPNYNAIFELQKIILRIRQLMEGKELYEQEYKQLNSLLDKRMSKIK